MRGYMNHMSTLDSCNIFQEAHFKSCSSSDEGPGRVDALLANVSLQGNLFLEPDMLMNIGNVAIDSNNTRTSTGVGE